MQTKDLITIWIALNAGYDEVNDHEGIEKIEPALDLVREELKQRGIEDLYEMVASEANGYGSN